MNRPLTICTLLLATLAGAGFALRPTSARPFAPALTPAGASAAAPATTARGAEPAPAPDRRAVADGVYSAAKGTELHLATRVEARTVLRGGGDGEQTLAIVVEGTLAVLVADRRDADHELVCEIRLLDGVVQTAAAGQFATNAVLTDALRGGSQLRMGADGRLIGLRFGAAVPPDARGLVRTLVAALATVVPGGDDAVWATSEPDPTALASFEYRRADGVIVRRKLGYLADPERPDLPLPEVAGEGRSTLAAEHGWVRSVKWFEASTLTMPDAQITLRSTLAAAADLANVVARDPASLPAVDWDGPWSPICGAAESRESAARLEADRWEEQLRGETAGTLTARILQLVEAGALDGMELFDARESLVWLLRLRPEALDDLRLVLARGDLDAVAASVLLGAVGAVGTPAAQSMIATYVGDPAWSEDVRMAAARALFEVRAATPELIAAVGESVATAPAAVAGTALLALGAFGATDEDVVVRLVSFESAAEERGLAIDWLRALGNAGRPEVVAAVERHLVHEDDAVRTAALDALRLVDTDAATARIVRTATDDTSPQVRAAAAELLAERPQGVRDVESLLSRESEPFVRRAALLGLVRNTDPAAAILLRRAAATDPDPRVREFATELLTDG